MVWVDLGPTHQIIRAEMVDLVVVPVIIILALQRQLAMDQHYLNPPLVTIQLTEILLGSAPPPVMLALAAVEQELRVLVRLERMGKRSQFGPVRSFLY